MNNPYAAEINAVNEYVVNDVISRLNNDPTFDSSIISDLKEVFFVFVFVFDCKKPLSFVSQYCFFEKVMDIKSSSDGCQTNSTSFAIVAARHDRHEQSVSLEFGRIVEQLICAVSCRKQQ